MKVLVFRYMDTNGDGYMDLAELLKVIELPLAEAFSPTVSTPPPLTYSTTCSPRLLVLVMGEALGSPDADVAAGEPSPGKCRRGGPKSPGAVVPAFTSAALLTCRT